MCLTTKTIEPSTSSYNIEVYKVIRTDLKSIYNPSFKYKIGVVMNDDAEEDITSGFNHYFVKAGYFHSYKSLEAAQRSLEQYSNYNKYHKINIKYDIYRGEIPEGTQFLEDSYGKEICSKSLKLIERV